MFKVGTMLKAREVRLSRKKPPYHPALIPGTRSKMEIGFRVRGVRVGVPLDSPGYLSPSIEAIAEAE